MKNAETKKTVTTIKNIMMAVLLWLCGAMPATAQTELYKQYSHLKDVTVACIMNFYVNDTTQVEITILAPQTKEAVYTLVEEFNLGIEKDIIDKDLGDEYSGFLRLNVCSDNVKKAFGPISSYDYTNVSKLVYNRSKGVIVIFHNIETEQRDIAISKFLTGTLTEPEKFPSIDNANNKK